MTTFKKYGSIENSYREKFLESLRRHDYDHDEREYVVQEKVHGSNLSFHMSQEKDNLGNKTILTAKRTCFVGEDENFLGYQRVRDRLKGVLFALFAEVTAHVPNVTTVVVYGEIFGGMYDHPDVEAVQNVSKVQKGIHYHPDVHFYAFDILVNNETYLDVDLVNSICEEVGLFYARTLFRGSLKDALAYPNDFDSNIGAWLGLPTIAGNTCEGVVIRPVETLFLRGKREYDPTTGQTTGQGRGSRVILKNKNAKWEENQRVQKQRNMVEQLGSDAAGLQAILKGYLTTNRVQNVMSKMSDGDCESGQHERFSLKDIPQIMRQFMPDAMEDFEKDYGPAWNALGKNDHKKILKGLNKYAGDQVRAVLTT